MVEMRENINWIFSKMPDTSQGQVSWLIVASWHNIDG